MKTNFRFFFKFILFLSSLFGFSVIIFFRVTLALARHSLFFYWLSLEINIISVLPLLCASKNINSSETALKYFVSQSIASILFLFFYSIALLNTNFLNLLLALMIIFKLGIPPFHRWLARIVLLSPYKILFILLFVQKFIPLHIISNLNPLITSIRLIILFTLFISLPIIKNISSLRVMLLLSAWRNSIWVIVSSLNSKVWALFLFFYGVFLGSILILFTLLNVQKISSFLSLSLLLKFICLLNLLNLAGLPPISGFFVKLLLLKRFITRISILVIILLLNLALIILFSYITRSFYLLRSTFTLNNKKFTSPTFFNIGLRMVRIFLLPLLLILPA